MKNKITQLRDEGMPNKSILNSIIYGIIASLATFLILGEGRGPAINTYIAVFIGGLAVGLTPNSNNNKLMFHGAIVGFSFYLIYLSFGVITSFTLGLVGLIWQMILHALVGGISSLWLSPLINRWINNLYRSKRIIIEWEKIIGTALVLAILEVITAVLIKDFWLSALIGLILVFIVSLYSAHRIPITKVYNIILLTAVTSIIILAAAYLIHRLSGIPVYPQYYYLITTSLYIDFGYQPELWLLVPLFGTIFTIIAGLIGVLILKFYSIEDEEELAGSLYKTTGQQKSYKPVTHPKQARPQPQKSSSADAKSQVERYKLLLTNLEKQYKAGNVPEDIYQKLKEEYEQKI